MACDGARELFQVAERFRSPEALNKAFSLLILSSAAAAQRGAQIGAQRGAQELVITGCGSPAETTTDATSMWEPPCLDPREKDTMVNVNIVLEVLTLTMCFEITPLWIYFSVHPDQECILRHSRDGRALGPL